MARTRTLEELMTEVRSVADIEGAYARHTPLSLTAKLNQSIQAFRLMISSSCDYYKTSTATLTINSGDTTVPVPVDMVRLYAFDVLVTGRWRELSHYQMAERNDYQFAYLTSGVPTAFRERNGSLIDFMPQAAGAYSYRLWYLPTGTDLINDIDEFDGVAGWEDWVVYDTALRCSTRDADINDNFQLIQAELARIEQRILKEASRRVSPGAARRIDTKGRREGVGVANRWRWP